MTTELFSLRGLVGATTWADRSLSVGVVLAALLAPALARPPGDGPLRAIVTVDRAEVAVLPLDHDGEATVHGRIGDVTLAVRDRTIRVSASTCPQHVCMASGAKGRAGDLIACVPNQLLVRIVGGPAAPADPDAPDAVTR